MSQAEATEAMKDEDVGHVIIRPGRSSAGLWLSIKLHDGLDSPDDGLDGPDDGLVGPVVMHQSVDESDKVGR